MTTLAQQADAARRKSDAHSAKQLASYSRKRKWSRTDSARWLSARSEPVLARLRRLGRECPAYSKQVGNWLREEARDRAVFDRVHTALAALPDDDAREAALVLEVLR